MNVKLTKITVYIFVSFFSILINCAPHIDKDRHYISNGLLEKIGDGLPSDAGEPGQLPDNVTLADGLTREEAVAIALWNNARFQADLAQLGLAKADLIQAGMITNPVFSYLFPWGPKQLEATLSLPIEVLWQRPYRVAMAKLNASQVAESLLQSGLDLVLEVQTAYVDLWLAEKLAAITQEESVLQKEVADIAESRLRLGDISELEATAIRLEAAWAEENAITHRQQAQLAAIHLKTILGFILQDVEFDLTPQAISYNEPSSINDLLALAYAARPDLRAAELSIESAGKKLGWERSQIYNFTAVLDANGQGTEGFEMGPGMKFDVPLLNWNQGGRARATAELEEAVKLYLVKKEQITQNVLKAHADYQASYQILSLLSSKNLPAAIRASKNAENAYLLGELSYLELLVFKRQVLSIRVREADAAATFEIADAQLSHAIGFSPQSGMK